MAQVGEKVTVSVKGEETGTQYDGVFRVKTRLSVADSLRQDQVQRELLGAAPGNPTLRAAQTAHMLSHLAVRVLDAPSWWKESAEDLIPGMALEDPEVLSVVFDAVMAVDTRMIRLLKDEAEKARKDLEAQAPEAPKA